MSKSGLTQFDKGGNAGSKGVDFQVGLLTVTWLNALNKLKGWKLSTENQRAGKFDDVVLEWEDGSVLLQAKFRENKKKISFDELTSVNSKKSEFSLQKYYFSYQKIKNEFHGLTNVILCTNADIKIDKKFFNKEVIADGSILNHENGNGFVCKFTYDLVPELKNKLQEYCDKVTDKDVDTGSITEGNIKEFLDCLQLYCNYPSGRQLCAVIEQLISHLEQSKNLCSKTCSTLISRKMIDWFQQEKGVCLTETHAKAMFYDIRSDKYCEMLKQYNVFFQDVELIFQNPKKIFHVVTDNLIDVINTYRSLESYKKRNLYVNPDEGIDVLEDALEVFQLPEYVFLIIVKLNVTDDSVIVKMGKVLQKSNYKKIILIGNNNLTKEMISSGIDYEAITTNVTFADMSDKTQAMLKQKQVVIFQGKRISLQALVELPVPEHKNYDHIVNCDILQKLVLDEHIVVGADVPKLDEEIERFYLKRVFRQDATTISEEEIYDRSEKIVLISDDAGMGKSTVLTKMANLIKAKYPHLWVVRINLSEYTRTLNDIQKKHGKNLTVVGLLNGNRETKLTTECEEKVFSMQGKVVLMLDGLDEISPDYTDITLNLLSHCKEQQNFAKIFVTTRPHIASNLEGTLKAKSFSLEPFTEQNQKEFLVRYWSHNLNLDKSQEERCKKYTEELWKKIFSISWNFAAMPLHVMMLADVFQENGKDWQSCEEYLSADDIEPKLRNNLKITELYNLFVDNKKHIFLEKVNPSGIPAGNSIFIKEFDECLAYHRALALEELLEEQQRKIFLSHCQPISRDMELSMLRMGIVQKTDNTVRFIHRTFAEYFVAQCIFNELEHNSNAEFQSLLIEHILYYDKYKIIRAFLDGFLKGHVDILPPNIFDSYYSCYRNCEVSNKYEYGFLRNLSKEGLVSLLQLILKYADCIPSTNKTTPDSSSDQCVISNRLKFFLQQAGVNIVDNMNKTPLHYAVGGNQLEMVEFLIENGADINKYIDELFHTALCYGHFNMVKFLVKQGARITERHFICKTYKQLSSHHTDIAAYIFQLILNKNDLNVNEFLGPYLAAYFGHIYILQDFVERGVDVNSLIENGDVISFGAVRGNQFDILKYLCQKGADLSRKNDHGKTLLHVACHKGYLHIVKFLLEKFNAGINLKDGKERTPLHRAVSSGKTEIVRFLVNEHNADVNVTNNNGQTPLHLAAFIGYSSIVQFLVEECNADINVKDNKGQIPLHCACFSAKLDAVQVLVEGRNTDINAKDNNGQTPLHCALTKAYRDIIRFLIEKPETDINAKDGRNKTPLYYAIFRGYLDIVWFLIKERNAEIDAKDDKGQTLLHLAVLWNQSHIVRFLIDELHVDINAKDNKGQTALDLASKNRHSNSIITLLTRQQKNYEVQNELFLHNTDGGLHVKELLIKTGKYYSPRMFFNTPTSSDFLNYK